jgi:hypothetical protein
MSRMPHPSIRSHTNLRPSAVIIGTRGTQFLGAPLELAQGGSCPNSKGRYFEEIVVARYINQHSSSHSESNRMMMMPRSRQGSWSSVKVAQVGSNMLSQAYPSRTGRSYRQGARTYVRFVLIILIDLFHVAADETDPL